MTKWTWLSLSLCASTAFGQGNIDLKANEPT